MAEKHLKYLPHSHSTIFPNCYRTWTVLWIPEITEKLVGIHQSHQKQHWAKLVFAVCGFDYILFLLVALLYCRFIASSFRGVERISSSPFRITFHFPGNGREIEGKGKEKTVTIKRNKKEKGKDVKFGTSPFYWVSMDSHTMRNEFKSNSYLGTNT